MIFAWSRKSSHRRLFSSLRCDWFATILDWMAQTPARLHPTRLPGPREIERLAFDADITVAELCRRAEVHPSTFRYWKVGRTSPSIAIVQALLDAGWAAVAAAERAEAKAAPAQRRPRVKATAKAKAAPMALRRQMRRSA
jgi:transposase-like protein